jgi:hypothetical protein
MTPLDVHVEGALLHTPTVEIYDVGLDESRAPVFPLGVGVVRPVPVRRASIVLGADLRAAPRVWDGPVSVVATAWELALDGGWRWGEAEPEDGVEEGRGYWTLFGGARVPAVTVTGFEPWLSLGLGGCTGLGFAHGARVRVTAEVLGCATLAPAWVSGAIDSGRMDLTWWWTGSSARLAVRAGVALR